MSLVNFERTTPLVLPKHRENKRKHLIITASNIVKR